jgi:hypothetical protein
MKRVFAAVALVWLIPVRAAFAQSTTTISYDAAVTFASGPHAASFSAGDPLVVSYTLDASVADVNADSSNGLFFKALQSLSVSFPGRGVSAVAGGGGTVQTFNNVVDASSGKWSDQVFFIGGPISSSSSLDGEPIDFIEVDFLTDFLVPPDEPFMLASDALPLFRLVANDRFMFLHTSSGFTSVHFTTGSPQTPEQQIQAVIASIQRLVSGGTLKFGQATGLTQPLLNALRSLSNGKTTPACSQIADFETEVNDKVLGSVLTAAQGAAFIDAAETIRAALGC